MIQFAAIALFLALLIGPVGNVVVGSIETGYEVRESNTRLAVAATEGGGAEIVPAGAYVTPGEE